MFNCCIVYLNMLMVLMFEFLKKLFEEYGKNIWYMFIYLKYDVKENVCLLIVYNYC